MVTYRDIRNSLRVSGDKVMIYIMMTGVEKLFERGRYVGEREPYISYHVDIRISYCPDERC